MSWEMCFTIVASSDVGATSRISEAQPAADDASRISYTELMGDAPFYDNCGNSLECS